MQTSQASETRRRGGTQPDPLSLADVVEAALTLTERNGLHALTIKAVADELGITSPGVYHYVTGKQELVDRLCEQVTRRVDLTTEPDAAWQDRVVTIMTRMGAAFALYPGVAGRALSFIGPAPGALRITETILAILEAESEGERFTHDEAMDMVAGLHFLFSGWLLGRPPIVDSKGVDHTEMNPDLLERTTRRLLEGYAAHLRR